MSGIYIRGMEMPQNCYDCPFGADVDIGVGVAPWKRGVRYDVVIHHGEPTEKRCEMCGKKKGIYALDVVTLEKRKENEQ